MGSLFREGFGISDPLNHSNSWSLNWLMSVNSVQGVHLLASCAQPLIWFTGRKAELRCPFVSRSRGALASRGRRRVWVAWSGSVLPRGHRSQVLALHQAGAQRQRGRAGLGLERCSDVQALVRERSVAAGRRPHPLWLGARRRLLPLGCKTPEHAQVRGCGGARRILAAYPTQPRGGLRGLHALVMEHCLHGL